MNEEKNINIISTNENEKLKTDDIEGQRILSNAQSIIEANSIEYNKKRSKKIFIFLFLFAFFILIAISFSTIFALININNEKIINGVLIQGIDVSGLTKEEASKKVTSVMDSFLDKEITIKHSDFSALLIPKQFGVSFDIDGAINNAYSFGRDGNIFENNFKILSSLLNNYSIFIDANFDNDIFSANINEINSLLPDKVVNSDFYVDGNTLFITLGKDGYIVDENKFKINVLSNLEMLNIQHSDVEIPVTLQKAKTINIDEIYEQVHKEPVDAYYTTNPYVVHPSSTGLDFDISLVEAKELLKEQKDEYQIPLKTLYPKVSTQDIGSEAFPDLLSSFNTSFTSSNNSRSTNIRLSAQKINGLILMPDETFSFNQVVGKRTAAAGFQPAPAYNNGETVLEYGGGICQVSSTLYNAVLYSNLEIVERTNHGYKPSYVKPGLDATVSWGGPDFKFKNNRDYPIRLVCDTSNKILKIYIYGLKRDTDYKVVLDAQYVSTVYAQTTYKKDSSLASGQTKVVQSGSNGCKTATYKYLYDSSGTLISSKCISRDTYNSHNKVIAVGP